MVSFRSQKLTTADELIVADFWWATLSYEFVMWMLICQAMCLAAVRGTIYSVWASLSMECPSVCHCHVYWSHILLFLSLFHPIYSQWTDSCSVAFEWKHFVKISVQRLGQSLCLPLQMIHAFDRVLKMHPPNYHNWIVAWYLMVYPRLTVCHYASSQSSQREREKANEENVRSTISQQYGVPIFFLTYRIGLTRFIYVMCGYNNS